MKLRPFVIFSGLMAVAISAGLFLGLSEDKEKAFWNSDRPVGRVASDTSVWQVDSPQPGLGKLKADARLPDGVRLFPEFVWKAPRPHERTPSTSAASLKVLGEAVLQVSGWPQLKSLRKGEEVVFPLAGDYLAGVVESVFADLDGKCVVSGSLRGRSGQFFVSQDQVNRSWSGHLIDRTTQFGYEMLSEGSPAQVTIRKQPLEALVCAMPRYRDASEATPVPVHASKSVSAAAPPVLNSKPGAAGVLLLDFDGAMVMAPEWNGGALISASPATIGTTPMTAAQITDVWRRVAEDFRPFDVNVTTDEALYLDSSKVGHRGRCIITPTDSWYYGTAGGVAYLNSYRGPSDGWSSAIPCWCWNNSSTAIMAMTISHEFGHMMDLSHDGTTYDTYYRGHDSGVYGWGPIMGAPFTKPLVQWSKGEYPGANNPEDDFAVVANTISQMTAVNGYLVDDVPNLVAAAKPLAFTSPIHQAGVITSSQDVDVFSFKTKGGPFSITVTPDSPEPNLDPSLELLDSSGAVIFQASQSTTTLAASLVGSLPVAGTYYLAVKGRGRPASPTITGYTSYGSAGSYTISGTYAPLPEAPLITVQPLSVTNVIQGSRVTLSVAAISSNVLTYQWYRLADGVETKLTGRTASALVFTSIQPTDIGLYKVVISNVAGASTSEWAAIDVRYKPVIKVQPSPVKLTSAAGSDVVFSVTAIGTDPISYQWKKNGVVIAGETQATLQMTAIDWFDAGAYTVTVSNGLGSVTSLGATLTVSSAPVFTQQPGPPVKAIALGGVASVAVKTVGTAPISYQWFKNGVAIPRATAAVYSWAATQLLAEGTYYVRATNTIGSVESESFVVDVQDRPVIDLPQPPKTVNLNAESPLALDCFAHGTGPLVYQWQMNGINVTDSFPVVQGTKTPNLRVSSVAWAHKGTWRCVVTNAVGTAITQNVVVNVNSYPVIIVPPSNLKIAKNGTGTLKVVAGGSPPLKYQWFKDNQPIPGATAATLVLSRASPTTTPGSYQVSVMNTYPFPLPDPVVGGPAIVTVEDPPVASAPLPATQLAGIGDTVTITGSATGSPELRYQWQKNNVDMPGKTAAILTLSNVQLADSASYRVVVSNDVGKAYSIAAKLTVLTRPSITLHPISQTIYAWDSVSLSCAATGSPTLTYQWNLNGAPIPRTTNSTAVTSTLKLTSTQETQAGQYTVTVSNAVGSATSNAAVLTVNPVPEPELTDVRPTNVVVGSQILITGLHFNWVTRVLVSGKPVAFIKNRSSELWVTVPAGIPASGDLVVETRGGTATWSQPITLDTNGAENDLFRNAKILSGRTDVIGLADNTSATIEYNEPYSRYNSVWFRWRSPFTGKIKISNYGTTFDFRTVLYSGPSTPASPANLRYLNVWESGYWVDSPVIYTYNDVIKDQDYYIQVQSLWGYSSGPDIGYGRLRITITDRLYFAPRPLASADFNPAQGYRPGAPLDGQQQWLAEGGAAVVKDLPDETGETNGRGVVGGKASRVSVAAMPVAPSEAEAEPLVHASSDLSVQTQTGVSEEFSWGLYDSAGNPSAVVLFKTNDHSIEVLINGQRIPTGQVFTDDRTYRLDMWFDRPHKTWRMMLNGVAAAEGDGYAFPEGAGVQLAAGWVPVNQDAPSGRLYFDNVRVDAATGNLPGDEPAETEP